MPKYVVDSYAWIEYLMGSSKGHHVKNIVEDTHNEVYSSIITIAEVASITQREKRGSRESIEVISNISKIYGMDLSFAEEAGLLHAHIREKIKDFGMADAVILLTARKLGAKVLTGDIHFKGFKEAVLI